MLYHLLDRIAGCRFIQDQRDIVVCTIEEATDDPLVSAVEAWGASVLRGPRDDVIRRVADAIEIHRFDGVVHANGDNLLTDPNICRLESRSCWPTIPWM